ncbi:MAG TPA: hypothetical protein VL485_08950 [Ktedonobacteraceae bacterium]|nr:hypothetical protein [Ktedonobacteraceae bacterium]
MQQSPFPMPPEQQPPSSIPQQPPSPFVPYPPYQNQPQSDYPSNQNQAQPGYPLYQAQPGWPGYQFQQEQLQTGKIAALKYGLIFGGIIAFAAILEAITSQAFISFMVLQYHSSITSVSFYSLLVAAIFILIYWALYFFAGFLAARRSQRAVTASIAGLWMSLCYFVMYLLILGFNFLMTLHMLGGRIIGSYFISLIGGFAIALFVVIGLGIGISVLGGLLGQSLARK